MKAQAAYDGYLEEVCRLSTAGQIITIPVRQRVHITVIDESAADNENAEAWQEFLHEIQKIDNEPLAEFERVKFREVEI